LETENRLDVEKEKGFQQQCFLPNKMFCISEEPYRLPATNVGGTAILSVLPGDNFRHFFEI